ncbi:MAG TPA: dihydrofolate reductase family protein [Anaerolineae bacterium]
MNELEPLETLFDTKPDVELPLPPECAALYGHLSFPLHPGRPYVISNFVTTLDGVASFGARGKKGGGEISGNNQHDRIVMGLLRAVSDAVVVGAGTLRGSPDHIWTADFIFPPLATAFQALRKKLGKSEPPLNVIVTSRGEIDPSLPVFQSGKVAVLIVTSPEGALQLAKTRFPSSVQIGTVKAKSSISATEVLHEVAQSFKGALDLLLVEGGPQLMGDFYAERVLDEQFLTLAPQVAGRDDAKERPGFVAEKILAPEFPTWGTLASVKRSASHLFLRYAFKGRENNVT